MADPFEDKLSALFDEPVTAPDETAFAARVGRRLARQAMIRRAWLFGAGLVGAAIALGQGFASGLGDRISGVGVGVMRDLSNLAANGDGATALNGAPTIGALALGLSILALAVIGVRAAQA